MSSLVYGCLLSLVLDLLQGPNIFVSPCALNGSVAEPWQLAVFGKKNKKIPGKNHHRQAFKFKG
jgi:hypothetical protein